MLDKKYNHKNTEEGKYNYWLDNKCFECGDESKKPFCIVIPPPNVTGKLHLGHAWDTTLQDIIIRYKKMQGFDTLWLPGMDHAGIATQAKIDAKLKSSGINPREMDREEWMKHAWSWKEEYSNNIREQWGKLGLALDYSKERFTLDDGLSKAVRKIFIDLYNKGWIYRGERIINWDPEAQTALSNEEVIHKEIKGAFYHIKYFIEDSKDFLNIATTRPETMFGDTGIAVNPNDERYKHLIGKNAILPIANRLIPIVGDEHADMEFGTGIVKITPAHDPNDFEVGLRHNLERIVCMNPNATMNENALHYNGFDRYECRKALIEELKEKGHLIEIEEITHNVGHSERTDVMIEPYLSKQWFVKMDKLAEQVLNNQKDSNTKVCFVPKRFEKDMNRWMEIAYDWCISRQLWWGHRIPAWYKDDEVYVGWDAPKGEGWTQDADVLDTWFSSALWPFSTLGWPEETNLLKRYYPNDVLVTGYDIIFFWVCRMVFQGLEFCDERPFKEVLIHGLIRDKIGRKMSKSLGNGVDPMDVIEEYGADALRFNLSTSSAPGQDLRFDMDKVASSWNFINKIWNASRFTLIKLEDFNESDYTLNNLNDVDKWIITKLNETVKSVTRYMEKYEFNNVGNILHSFIWNDFCDNYIELSKFSETNATKSTLYYVLLNILKMLQPFMPYVTEEIYTMLKVKEEKILMNASYPKYNSKEIYKVEKENIDKMLEFITLFRNRKAEFKISGEYDVVVSLPTNESLIISILKLNDKITDASLLPVKTNVELYDMKIELYYDNSESLEEERILLEKEKNELKISIERREKLLSNEGYVTKAPKEIVDKEKELLEKEKERLDRLN